jgi:hypothetical protein
LGAAVNLIDLITRQDKLLLEVGAGLEFAKVPWLKEGWRAVVFADSETPQIVLKNLRQR